MRVVPRRLQEKRRLHACADALVVEVERGDGRGLEMRRSGRTRKDVCKVGSGAMRACRPPERWSGHWPEPARRSRIANRIGSGSMAL